MCNQVDETNESFERYDHDSNRQDRVMARLRTFGADYSDFTRRFAASLGLYPTDAAALVQILSAEDQGKPLSPAELSKLLPLSRAATSALLDRLEKETYILRSRESHDRRRVTIRSSPSIHTPAISFFTPLSESIDDLLAVYTPEFLDQLEHFLVELHKTMDRVRETS